MHNLRRSMTLRAFQGVSLPTAKPSFAIRTVKAMPIVASGRPKKNQKIDMDDVHPKSDKNRRIEDLITLINKEHGKGTLQKLVHMPDSVPTFSSGLLSLDLILGGGVPAGRIIEIFGPEGGGKTTLALHFMQGAQGTDDFVQYVDTEFALDPKRIKRIGVDPERMLIAAPTCGEECFSLLDKSMRSRLLSAICVDSVASLIPTAELEGGIEDQQMALQARLMSKGMKRVVQANRSAEQKYTVTVVFVNQIRTKPGIVFGNPETRPGGKALPFYAMTILEVRPGPKIEDASGKPIGHKLKVKNPKNKISSPFRTVELDLLYETGICKASSLLDGAIEMEVIKQNGSYYSFGTQKLGQGRQKVVDLLKGDPELFQKIDELARAEHERRSNWDTQPPPPKEPTLNVGNGHEEDPEPMDLEDSNITIA